MSEMGERLRAARIAAKFSSAAAAAKALGISESTYRAHENGQNDFGPDEAAVYARKFKTNAAFLLTGEASSGDDQPSEKEVAVVGYLGAGGEVMPEFEQTPPEGFEQVTLPFYLPDDLWAFRVRGISMLPVFKPDSVIVVYREQRKPIESFYGEEAAVRTADGRRFIKTITRGSEPGTVNLMSFNDHMPIENQRLEWIGEIFAILPPAAIRRAMKQGGVQGSLPIRTGTG